MRPLQPPHLSLPPPLRGVDDAPTGFTYDSIHRRLPLILDELVSHSRGSLPEPTVAAIHALRAEIVRDAPLSPPCDTAWAAYMAPHAGRTWLTAPWWLAENYLYERVREAVAAHGGPSDPFAPQKDAALHGARRAFVQSVLPIVAGGGSSGSSGRDGGIGAGALPAAVYRALWGNRADLSLHTVAALATGAAGGGGGGSGGAGSSETDPNAGLLLVDDVPAAVARVRAASASSTPTDPARVALILDNCGLELLSDLALVDALLRDASPLRVTLWAKSTPVFVSDAQPHDVDAHVAWLGDAAALEEGEESGGGTGGGAADMRALAARLRGYLADGSLIVTSHPFFCSPLAFWDAPSELAGALAGCALVIVKGDANYRRLLGDAHWAHDTAWAAVTAYFPAPLLALRTAKSGIVAGLPRDAEAAAAAAHPSDWLTSGRYGMAQLGGRL